MRREVLILTPTLPLPVRSGGARRTLELCVRAATEVPIRLLCTGDGADRLNAQDLPFPVEVLPLDPLPALRAPLAARPERWFHSPALSHRAGQLVGRGQVSVVHLDDLAIHRALPHSCPPIVAHHHKLEPELASALGQPWHAIIRWRRAERRVIPRAAHHVTCSTEDATRLSKRFPGIATTALPCGADVDAFAPNANYKRDARRLLFLGSLDYAPNRLALDWLIGRALPAWRKRFPDLVLEVVGAGKPCAELDWATPGVELVGEVKDVIPHLHRATAMVVPLSVGGGSRVKLAEALAAECPIVATPLAAEGLGIVGTKHAVLAPEGGAFLRAVERMLDEPEMARARALEGRALAQTDLGWDALAERLVHVWSAVQRVASNRSGVASASSSSRSREMNAGTSAASK